MFKYFILFFITSFSIFAQNKTKKVEILSTSAGEYLNANYLIEEGKQDILNIHFFGRDHQYQQIDEYLTFYSGSPKDFYIFINKLKEAFNSEINVTQSIDGCIVTTEKSMGKKIISVKEGKKSGYRLFNLKVIDKVISKFEIWCIENKIEYK